MAEQDLQDEFRAVMNEFELHYEERDYEPLPTLTRFAH